MTAREKITINHLGRGLIGPLYEGVIVGVCLAAKIAKIDTKINNKIETKIGSELIGSLKIGSESYARFITRGAI